jgi:putative transposase
LPPLADVAYWRLHYHLVWATDERRPTIDAGNTAAIHHAVYGKAQELGIILHAVGGVADHLHVVASVPPKLALADCVGKLKGASSHAVNLGRPGAATFRWQAGYGALSVGGRALPQVVAYVHDQAIHHQKHSTIGVYERMTDSDDGVPVLVEPADPE